MAVRNLPINFGAGPGKIPREVLKEIQDEFLDYNNLGFSITELSHRSPEYANINRQAQEDLRELLSIPKNYKVIFLHGGGQGIFSAIPMNLMKRTGKADYAITGIWSKIAANEAKKYGDVNYLLPNTVKSGTVSDENIWNVNPEVSYFFYCDNETIEGTEYSSIPDTKGVPVVTDMSSSIMTKRIDISKFGLIFAAAQKNLGTAGVGIVIIRDDLLGNPMDICPSFLNFTLLSNADSILNTPPIFSIYLLGKVLKWVKNRGGIEEMEKQCKRKSKLLYDTITNSNNFYSMQNESTRSRVNVPFRIKNGDIDLETKFLKEAEAKRMYQLKGHKLVGGIRVSLYNSISYEDVEVLTKFMQEFQEQNQN